VKFGLQFLPSNSDRGSSQVTSGPKLEYYNDRTHRAFRGRLSEAAKKGTSLAVEREPGVGLRSGLLWAQK
jgi:hypothetical protein